MAEATRARPKSGRKTKAKRPKSISRESPSLSKDDEKKERRKLVKTALEEVKQDSKARANPKKEAPAASAVANDCVDSATNDYQDSKEGPTQTSSETAVQKLSPPPTNTVSEEDVVGLPSPPQNTLSEENLPPPGETASTDIGLVKSSQEQEEEIQRNSNVPMAGREGFRVYRDSVANEETVDVIDGKLTDEKESVQETFVISNVISVVECTKESEIKEEKSEAQDIGNETEVPQESSVNEVYYTEIDSPESEEMMPAFGLERTVDGAVSDLQTELRMAESMTETEAVIDLQSELMMAESMHEQLEQETEGNRFVEGSESVLTDFKQLPTSPIVRSESDLNAQRNRIIEGAEADVPMNLNQTEISENESKRKSLILPRSKEDALCWEVEDFKQEGLMPTAPHLYPKLEEIQGSDIKPLTDEQLKSLYYNGELESLDDFVEEFLKTAKCDRCEFYELVLNYYRARNHLVSAEQDVQTLRADCDKHLDLVWTTSQSSVLVTGKCQDQYKVTKAHVFDITGYNEQSHNDLSRTLKTLRNFVHEELSLYAYSAQLSRLQVESYLHEMFKDCPGLKDIPHNAPVATHMPNQRDSNMTHQVEALKTCIKVLFTFQRKPTTDSVFIKDTRKWLRKLVAVLLRLSTLEDHLFVINQLLRCPPGVGQWASNFIQIKVPSPPSSANTWDSPLLDHCIAMLATLLMPVKGREQLLYQLKGSNWQSESAMNSSNHWILVDSDGEEDEDVHSEWQLLAENDLVAMMEQFPISDVFRRVLLVSSENGSDNYDITRYNESGMIKLFAFATALIKIIGAGLDNFCLARYRQLNKRLARMILQLLDYISDHWEMFLIVYQHDINAETLYRLQLEYDNVFCRAVKTILGAQRLGSWQYLADLPYRCVSSQMVWRLLWLMHHGYKHTDISISIPIEQCRQILEDPDCREYFEGKLITMPTSEAIYLLTTFANLAKSRPSEERTFVEAIATEVYEIAYISNHTRDFSFKVGRDLLASICTEHPFIMSLLMGKVQQTMDQVGMVALGLFQELPLEKYSPTADDMELLKTWVLENNMDSAANQLARLVISRLNWGADAQKQGLFLDIKLHREIAVLLVQAYMKHLTNKNVVGYFTVGMKQVVSAVWSQLSTEQKMSNWAWEVAMKLCLHVEAWHHHDFVNPTALQEFSQTIPDINGDPMYFPIVKGLKESCGLAHYLAFVMSKYSHSMEDFCDEGLLLFSQLVDQHYYVPALRALFYISNIFHSHPAHLETNPKFLQSFQQLFYSDQHQKSMAMLSGDFPGPVTKLFANMIQNQLQRAKKVQGQSVVVTQFWLRLLTRMTQWNHDRNILFILDNLLRATFRIAEAHEAVCEYFKQMIMEMVRNPNQQQQGGVLSSIVSWIASGKNQHSLIDSQSCAEFSWFAFTVFYAETEVEDELGLWGALGRELHSNPNLSVDQALKNAQTNLKTELPTSPQRLSLYRWLYQAVDMDLDHPLLPLVWQNFFLRYLGRPAPETGLPERGSVGEKFFESTTNISLMKRIKKRLTEAAEFHHTAMSEQVKRQSDVLNSCNSDERSSEDEGPLLVDNEEIIKKRDFHCLLVKFYQTIKNWLDEPRLHDASMYLPALPSQYEADRLLTVFQNQKMPWLEFMNMCAVDKQVTDLCFDWDIHCTVMSPDGMRNLKKASYRLPPNQRILQRLSHGDKPKPPPGMTAFKAPVPEVNAAFLCDTQSLFYALRSDFVSLTDYAKLFSKRVSKHVGLDINFLEYLPSLYKNELQEVVVSIPCQSMVNPLHKCKGPAAVTIRYEAKTQNEITGHRVNENRVEYKQLMIESLLPPAQNLCSSAVHVENAITALIRMVHMSASDITKAAAIEAGTALFYHMSTLITEDIKNYPPTRQFFSACIEILGQEFVLNNSVQCQPLLQAILTTPSLVGLLAPNFSPNASPELFVTMYENMITVPTNQGCDVAFTLLTKYDVRKWLDQANPSMSQRSALVEVIGNALCVCGPDPESKFRVVFEVYRRHLQHLLRHHFPDHYADVLKLIIKGSSSGSASVELWDDFLAAVGCPRGKEDTGKNEETSSLSSFNSLHDSPKYQVSVNHMKETMDWLSSYFFRLRVCQDETARFGLYPKWRPYVPALTSFLSYLTCNTIKQVSQSCHAGDRPHIQVLMELWQQISDLFAPWVRPLDNSGQILTPWIQADHALASNMVCAYAEGLKELHAQFQASIFDQNVLGLLWPHYVNILARPGTPEHVLSVFHSQLLALPWNSFHPDTLALDMMLQMQDTHSHTCFVFLANIFTKMIWMEVMQLCANRDILVRLHICLFHLLVKMAMEDDILQGTNLEQLMMAAENFNWGFLDSLSYSTTITQLMDHCEPSWVLKDRTSKEYRVLSLLKCASGFGRQDWVDQQPETPVKRCAYIRCVVTLLCRVSHLPNIDPAAMDYFLNNLLTEVETVITQVSEQTAQYQEAVSQCSEVLNLLNNCDAKNSTLVSTLVDWIISSPTSVLLQPLLTAACRTLASHVYLALVIEACIDAHFSSVEEPAGDIEGWGWVLAAVSIPDMNQKSFLKACVENGSYLTLFTYTLQRLPLCQNLNDEMPHLNNLISWTTMARPCRENEGKLLLWWAKVVELIIRHLHFGGNPQFVVRWLNTFVPALFGLAEDKSSQGLLGAIGLGRRSQLSQRFRLVTKALGTFVLAQMPTNGEVRAEPNAAGAIKGQHTKQIKPTPAANAALHQLEGLGHNKQYTSFKQHIEYSVDFICNTEHCIRDTPALVLFLVRELYSEKPFLGILLTSTPSRVTSPTTGVTPPMPGMTSPTAPIAPNAPSPAQGTSNPS